MAICGEVEIERWLFLEVGLYHIIDSMIKLLTTVTDVYRWPVHTLCLSNE